MKRIAQIPRCNKERTPPQPWPTPPRRIDGLDEKEILVIEDGSTNRTVELARQICVDHIVRRCGSRGGHRRRTAPLRHVGRRDQSPHPPQFPPRVAYNFSASFRPSNGVSDSSTASSTFLASAAAPVWWSATAR